MPPTLKNGQSELDSAVIRLPGTSFEIRNWDRLELRSSFTSPCDELSFTVSDEDVILSHELLVSGAPIELAINDRLQFSGYIGKKTIQSARGGTSINVSARDKLGPVVAANINPRTRVTAGMSLLDLLATVLVPFGIPVIYNDGSLNVNLQSGMVQKPRAQSAAVSVQIPRESLSADGTIKEEFETVKATQKTSGPRKDLTTLKLQDMKPQQGEGAYAFCEKMVKRFGLRLYAAADGSGAIVDRPNFDQPAKQTIRHIRSTSTSDVISASLDLNWGEQPSCIVATGIGAQDPSLARSSMTIIMVNELVGVDSSKQILPEIKAIIAGYKGAKVLPLRSQLTPHRKSFASTLVGRPMFYKDDAAKTLEQLEHSVRREMANRQHQGFKLTYEVVGWTQGGYPWCTNSMVSVRDEVLGIDESLWVLEREFRKSRSGGTTTHLTLIRPHTLSFGE